MEITVFVCKFELHGLNPILVLAMHEEIHSIVIFTVRHLYPTVLRYRDSRT